MFLSYIRIMMKAFIVHRSVVLFTAAQNSQPSSKWSPAPHLDIMPLPL
jgi:hypothetical protein